MKVRYTRTAISEVDEIFSYISERNPRSAAQVIEAVARTVRRIAQFPESAIGGRAGCPCRCCRSTSLSGFLLSWEWGGGDRACSSCGALAPLGV